MSNYNFKLIGRKILSEEIKEDTTKDKDVSKIKDKLIQFFTDNPNPDDDLLHGLAEDNSWDPHEVEEVVYQLVTEYCQFLVGGKSVEFDITEEDVDPEELKKGIKVEKEHTPNEETAKRIALDHLAEMDDYYTKLLAMEKK